MSYKFSPDPLEFKMSYRRKNSISQKNLIISLNKKKSFVKDRKQNYLVIKLSFVFVIINLFKFS